MKYAIGAIALLIAVLWMADSEYQDEIAQHEHYCEMIEIHKATDGQSGYPDDGMEC